MVRFGLPFCSAQGNTGFYNASLFFKSNGADLIPMTKIRGPRMGAWIRRGSTLRFGRPDFPSRGPCWCHLQRLLPRRSEEKVLKHSFLNVSEALKSALETSQHFLSVSEESPSFSLESST